MFLHKTPQPSSEPIDQSCIPHDLAIRLGSGNPGSSTQDPQKDLKLSPKHAKTSKNHPISPLRILPPTTPTDRLLPSVDPPLPVAHRSTRARPELDLARPLQRPARSCGSTWASPRAKAAAAACAAPGVDTSRRGEANGRRAPTAGRGRSLRDVPKGGAARKTFCVPRSCQIWC